MLQGLQNPLMAIMQCVFSSIECKAALLNSIQVVGEPGADLNYEETVVYDNDAIRPAFLIVYGEDTIEFRLKSLGKLLFTTPLIS